MTEVEVDAIQVENTPGLLQRTLPPCLKLFGEGLIESADCTRAGSYSDERLGHLTHFLRAHSCHKHLRQTLCHLRLISAITFEDLGMKGSFPISGDMQVFNGS